MYVLSHFTEDTGVVESNCSDESYHSCGLPNTCYEAYMKSLWLLDENVMLAVALCLSPDGSQFLSDVLRTVASHHWCTNLRGNYFSKAVTNQ